MSTFDAKSLRDKDDNDVNFTPTHYFDGNTKKNIAEEIAKCLKKSGIRGLVMNDGSIDTSVYALASALSNYILKSSTTGLVKNDGSIDTTAYATKAELDGYLEKSILYGIMKNDGSVIAANGDVYPLDISGNAHTVDNYHVVVGSVGANANTIYFF